MREVRLEIDFQSYLLLFQANLKIALSGKIEVMRVKYWVRLKGKTSDLLKLATNLKNVGYLVIKEDNVFYLTSSEFDSKNEVDEVYDLSCQILKEANSVSNVVYGINPEIIPEFVYQIQEDGTRVGFVYLSGAIETGQCDVYITQIKGGQVRNSDAESFEQWFNMRNDKNVKKILELFNNKTWVNLYIIYDIIKSEVGKINEKGWATKGDIDDFTKNAQFFRHGAVQSQKPCEPMSLQKAQSLLLHIIQQWLDWKCKQQ